MQASTLCFALTVILAVIYIILIYTHDKTPPISGKTQTAENITQYGFGPEKRLLIVDLSEIADVENIDPSDKKFARLTWSDTTHGTHTSTIGIELKGSGLEQRNKLNYAFEFWEPAEDGIECTSIETCEDDKVEMFDFGEKYEDYVLRGSYQEQTFVTDVLASQLPGGILQTRLVEVLLKFDDKYTYEGVYILFPAIQRRVLEKRLNWDAKGKAEDCDDEDYDIQKVSMILEHTIEANGRKKPCELFEDLDVKMRYPKCDFYDEEEIATCRNAYINRTRHYASVLSLKNTTEVQLDLDSFAEHYLAEIIIREGDFPYRSQYFYINPDDSKLYSGPRWDYDTQVWKVIETDTWDLYDIGYYNRGPIELWVQLGTNGEFIQKIKSKKGVVELAEVIVAELLQERKTQYAAGHFDREIERWGMFGKKRKSYNNVLYANYGVFSFGEIYSKSFLDDLDKFNNTIGARIQFFKENIEGFKGYGVRHRAMWFILLLNLSPLIVAVLVTATLCLCQKDKSKGRYKRILS